MKSQKITQKELLDWLVESGKLGKGKAEYEVNIGSSKSIDLVFKGENVIWLVEAKTSKEKLYEALGQIEVYLDLYKTNKTKYNPLKPLKTAIVCTESDPDIEYTCKKRGISLFIYKHEDKYEEEIKQEVICGICGSSMIKKKENWICKTCEYFFGISSKVERCRDCSSLYGAYSGVEDPVTELIFTDYTLRTYWIKDICPKCRKRKVSYYGTIAELIKYKFEKREITMTQLTNFCMLPKEFIEYCLGRFKPIL